MIRNYMKPTPKNMRALGDGLLSVATFVTAYAIANDIDWLSFTALFVGVCGKFLTNFFK